MLAIYVESNIYNEKSINSPQCLSLYMELGKNMCSPIDTV